MDIVGGVQVVDGGRSEILRDKAAACRLVAEATVKTGLSRDCD